MGLMLLGEIMIVAPYEKLAKIGDKIADYCAYSVDVEIWDSDQLKKSGTVGRWPETRIFIARGGVARYLRESTGKPVIEITVTAFDVLRAISETTLQGCRRIAIITPSNIIIESEHFVHLTDLILRFETCDDVDQIPGMVQAILEQEEIDAIVGDKVAMQMAEKAGIHGQLLESGRASLQIALDTAVNVLNAQTDQQIKLQETKFILNAIKEAVVTTDREGHISMLNTVAKDVLGLQQASIIGQKLSELNNDGGSLEQAMSRQIASENTLTIVQGKQVVLNHLPIVINGTYHGAVDIFEEVQQIQNKELKIRQKLHERGFLAKSTFTDIVTQSKPMQDMLTLAMRYARSDGTILIHGETGTGKELLAQSIHNASRRSAGPFVSVNCAAIDGDLLNSELFGYEDGAFTGATRGGRVGLFELAHGGTVFLDEVSEASLGFQAKLLRVIQEREIRRVGGTRIIPVNVRILCATNRDLLYQVRDGKFREDLLYRLNALELHLLPLTHRREDIIPIAIAWLNHEMKNEGRILTWRNERVFDPLVTHDWCGNIRELQNFVHRMVISCLDSAITQEFVQELLYGGEAITSINYQNRERIEVPLSANWNEMESVLWAGLLNHFGGDKEQLCQAYGISRTTLWRKLNVTS